MLLFVMAFAVSIVVFAYFFRRFMGATDTFDLADIMRQIKVQQGIHKESKKAKGAGVQ